MIQQSRTSRYTRNPATRLDLVYQKRRNRVKRPWPERVCIGIHAAAVLAVGIIDAVEGPWAALMLGGAIIAITYAVLAVNEARRGPLLVNPLSILYTWYGLSYGVAAAFVGTQMQEGGLLFFSYYIAPSDVGQGYVIALIGVLMLDCGLRTLRPRIPENIAPEAGDSFNLHVAVGLVLVGVLITYKIGAFAFLGAFSGIFQQSAYAALFILMLCPAERFRMREYKIRVWGILLTIPVFLVSLRSGVKGMTIVSLMPLGAYLLADRRRWKFLAVFVVVLTIGYLGILAPIVNGSRQEYGTWYERMEKVRDESALSAGFGFRDYVNQGRQLGYRLFEANVVGFLVAETRRTGFMEGETMRDLPYAFVPRIFWPNKPLVTRGAWFTAYLGFAPRASEATTSTGMLASGELYWNFGYPGVIVGMFLAGGLWGLAWRIVGPDPWDNLLGSVLFFIIALNMMTQAEASSVYVSSVFNIVVFGSIFLVARLGRTSPPVLRFRRQRAGSK